MVGADLAGLTDLCYGIDYLRGEASVDVNTGRAFSGEAQYVRGLTGLSRFCSTTAAGAKLVMACGKTAAAASSKLANATQAGSNAGSAERMALARRLGQAGEQAVGISGPKVGIRIPGTNTMRFPDQINRATRTLTEVKNVRSLSYTRQLRDYAAWTQRKGYGFDLWIRPSTRMSGPLLEARDMGLIQVRYIPGAK